MNMNKVGGKVIIKIHVTSKIAGAKVVLKWYLEEVIDLTLETVYVKEIVVRNVEIKDLELVVENKNYSEFHKIIIK